MEYTPISPFMRPISHAHLRVIERPEASVPGKPVNKWELLRELSKAQAAFGVTERDLTVLQGLLSFFPDDALGGNAEMVVFPSNKTDLRAAERYALLDDASSSRPSGRGGLAHASR